MNNSNIDKDSYIKGQQDLISVIKEKLVVLLEESKGSDILIDTIFLLKSIEPIELESDVREYEAYINDSFEMFTIVNGEHVPISDIQDILSFEDTDEVHRFLNENFKKETVEEIYWMIQNSENYKIKNIKNPHKQ